MSLGGELMGVAGMLIMIPLFSVLYTLLRELSDNRLEKRQIPGEKLMDQPLERRSKSARKQKGKKQDPGENPEEKKDE